jgi:hypothetical protein
MAKSIKFKNGVYLSTLGVLKVFYQYRLTKSFSKTIEDYEIIPFNDLLTGSYGVRHALTRNNGQFTVNDAGTYKITCSGYINPKTNSGGRYVSVFVNDVEKILITRADIPANQRTPFSFTYIVDLNAGDVFDLRFKGFIADDIWSSTVLILEQIQ